MVEGVSAPTSITVSHMPAWIAAAARATLPVAEQPPMSVVCSQRGVMPK